jgi:hypothetical protein
MEEGSDRRNVPGAHDQTKSLRLKPQTGSVITVVAVGVGIVFLVAAVILGTNFAPTNGTIEFELLKLIIQFLLIVALGAVVTIGVDAVRRRMDSEASQRQYEVDTLTSYLAQLDERYREVRRERRYMAIKIPMTYKYYNKAMRRLNDQKQDLEHLWRDEMQVVENWLPAIQGLSCCVKEMEDYLGHIEDEWKAVARAPNERLRAPLLEAFLAPTDTRDPNFRDFSVPSNFAEFRVPYRAARDELVKLLSIRRTGRQWDNRTTSRPEAARTAGPPRTRTGR